MCLIYSQYWKNVIIVSPLGANLKTILDVQEKRGVFRDYSVCFFFFLLSLSLLFSNDEYFDVRVKYHPRD